MLRQRGVVGKFVEFHGPGTQNLSLSDRSTIANMAPEYGATMGYFPIDSNTIDGMRLTGRDESHVAMVEKYLREQEMFVTHDGTQEEPVYSGDVMHLDLSSVKPSLSGPKRPHDRVAFEDMKTDFNTCMTAKTGFKGFGLDASETNKPINVEFEGKNYELNHGSLVIAAITSCTNTSNPDVMLGAGMLARNAVAKGLTVKPYIKCSLSPGSHVVTEYFEKAGVTESLN